MEISVLIRSYNTYGCDWAFSIAGRFLEYRLAELGRSHGPGLQLLDILVYLRSRSEKPSRDLASLYREHHASLSGYPKVVFRRKSSSLKYEFVSDSLSAEEVEGYALVPKRFNLALKELVAAIGLLKSKFKKSDRFAFDEFYADVLTVGEYSAHSEADVKYIDERSDKYRNKKQQELGPWGTIDVDWDAFHPQARTLLDDPFYWDCGDEFAPHGNDTGADLLTDFRKWRLRNRHGDPMSFLRKLLRQWDFSEIDWTMDDSKLTQALATAETALYVCDQAIIGLAFAQVKTDAACDEAVRDYALQAIRRNLTPIMLDGYQPPHRDRRKASLKKMAERLETL